MPSSRSPSAHAASALRRRLPAVLVVIGLGLLLAVQIVLADRAQLAASAHWRPFAETACTLLRCRLPAWHEPEAFHMLSREVRALPDQPGVLQVRASFRNDARWPQAWPTLELALADADGRVLGRGRFAPAQYLGHPPGEMLLPGQSAQVDFRIREPATGTVAFDFRFL